MHQALIGLGANLGDRAATLGSAVDALAAHPEITVREFAEPGETRPVGGPANQPPFLNSAAVLETTLSPEVLLSELLRIEGELGRVRDQRWSARTLDLDLLLYDDQIRRTPRLVLPHPWLPFRDFVLEPAVTIAPDWRHPELGARSMNCAGICRRFRIGSSSKAANERYESGWLGSWRSPSVVTR
ncbi:MAG: 2-amino-4-hydroxy-6-hydroxymethyldihydropteridine diphosphokinase [Pirellulales bacterium]